MKFKSFVFILLLLMVPGSALAGGFCCQMPAGVEQNGLTGAGGISLGVDYDYSRMSRFVEGDSYKSLNAVLHDPRFTPMIGRGVVPEVMTMQRITLSAAYQPTDRLVLSLSAPWVINDMSMRMWMMGKWTRMTMQEISELGDLTLFGSYRIYQDQAARPRTALWAGVGVKFPTGSSTVDEGGKRVHAHMQPGTGSWDPILSANFIKMLNSDFLWKADVIYHISTDNHLNYNYGNALTFDTSMDYNLTDMVNIGLGAKYFHSDKAQDPDNKYNGQDPHRLTDYVGYTGEDSIWISPTVRVMPVNGMAIDLKFQYPLYYHIPVIAQVTDFRVTGGISYSF